MTQRRADRALKRSYYYFRQGYSIVTMPFAFLSWATTLYYLAIKNIPVLENLFPRFTYFLLTGVFTIIPFCIFVGYLFIKRSWFYQEQIEIGQEVNPYATTKIQPVSVPIYEGWIWFLKEQGYDTTRIEQIVEASK